MPDKVNPQKSDRHKHFRFEVVSKPQIVFEGKAQSESKAQHTRKYVSILSRFATQPSDTRWGFETTSNQGRIP